MKKYSKLMSLTMALLLAASIVLPGLQPLVYADEIIPQKQTENLADQAKPLVINRKVSTTSPAAVAEDQTDQDRTSKYYYSPGIEAVVGTHINNSGDVTRFSLGTGIYNYGGYYWNSIRDGKGYFLVPIGVTVTQTDSKSEYVPTNDSTYKSSFTSDSYNLSSLKKVLYKGKEYQVVEFSDKYGVGHSPGYIPEGFNEQLSIAGYVPKHMDALISDVYFVFISSSHRYASSYAYISDNFIIEYDNSDLNSNGDYSELALTIRYNNHLPSRFQSKQIEIRKTDGLGTPLSGAQFQIRQGGSVIQTVTTGYGGVVTSNYLEPGSYQLVETIAPEGYVLNSTPIDLHIHGNEVNPIVKNVTNSKAPTYGNIEIYLRDNATKTPLAGGQFQISKYGGDTFTITTDSTGKAKINLEPGEYTVIQSVAPAGYNIEAGTFHFSNVAGLNTKLNFYNKKSASGKIEITKIDSVTSIPLVGATFQIKQSGSVIETITTDIKGKAKNFTNLAPGYYQLVEVIAPKGYILNTIPIDFAIVSGETTPVTRTVTNNKIAESGKIIVTKIDNTTGALLVGATFRIKQSGSIIETITTDTSGKASSTVKLAPGYYQLVEIIAPKGYILNSTPIDFAIVSGETTPVTRTVTNNKIVESGKIIVTKIDNTTGELLVGATFRIKQGGSIIETITTDTSGKASSTVKLAPGDYQLVEVIAPKGYALNSIPVNFTITAGSSEPVLRTVANTKAVGRVRVTKLDAVTSVRLAGAQFAILKDGEEIQTIKTNTSGIATNEINLEPGDYELVEIKAPAGYTLDSAPIPFEIVEGSTRPVRLTVRNSKLSVGSIEVRLKDQYGFLLDDGVFDIYKNGVKIETIITVNGKAVSDTNLISAIYQVKQVSAPKNYVADSKTYDLVVPASASPAFLNIVNAQAKGSVVVTKVDIVGNRLKGAVFNIINSSGGIVETVTSGPNGVAVSSPGLSAGNYYLEEVVAPHGHVLNTDPVFFKIVAGDTPIEITFVNSKDIRTLKILKDTGRSSRFGRFSRSLVGAKYAVKDSKGNIVTQPETDASGNAAVTDLPKGTYTLQETNAPVGYSVNKRVYVFPITESGSGVLQVKF